MSDNAEFLLLSHSHDNQNKNAEAYLTPTIFIMFMATVFLFYEPDMLQFYSLYQSWFARCNLLFSPCVRLLISDIKGTATKKNYIS